MYAMVKNMVGCSVFIFDAKGSHIATEKILKHDVRREEILIADVPGLKIDALYELLIPVAPIPYTCRGKVSQGLSSKAITLFRIKETENRRDIRYKVEIPAEIINLICEDVTYSMHRPVEVQLKNLSKNGIRFQSKYNTVLIGDRIRIRLKIDDDDKLLTAYVVYQADCDQQVSEYGCRLIGRNEI